MKAHQAIRIILLGLFASVVMSPAWSADTPTPSAFIEGEVVLQKYPDKAGAYRYEKPGIDLKNYSRVIIEPVEIWIHPESEYKGIRPDDLKAIGDSFVQTLMDELEPAYPVVNKAGPGTMVVRLAIIDVKMEKKKRGLLGYTPFGFVVTAVQDAASRVSLDNASIEAELLDAVTGERLVVLVDQGLVETTAEDEKLSWGDIEKRLRFYARRFRARLDAANK